MKSFIRDRDNALRSLDMDYARRMFPGATSDHVLLMAMHKARVEVVTLPEVLRRESMAWLKERGLRRMYPEMEWPEEDGLPE